MVAISAFSSYILPLIIVAILLCGLIKRKNIFALFTEGAKEGIPTAVGILPSLIALMMAVSMFRASGAFDLIANSLDPLCRALHFPSQVVPLALMRPISGSGSLSILEYLFKSYGPDSLTGRIASVLQGSTETTFYTIAVYYGSVQVSKTRHTVPASLITEFVGFVMSIIAVRLVFG